MPDLVVGSNSYIDATTADDYFDNRLGGEVWIAYDADTKDRALITASVQISLLVLDEYKLPFIPPLSSIPLGIACAELAFAMVLNPNVVTNSSVGSSVKRAKEGEAEVEFFSSKSSGQPFPDLVMDFLKSGDCLPKSTSIGIGKSGGSYSTGVDGTSSFTDIDRNGLVQGWP